MSRYLTSTSLIKDVKRRASLPGTQVTFTDEDFLAFANEELDLGVVPHILKYHEDYFLTQELLPLSENISRYEIPDRANGNKIRDVAYVDESGSIFEMTRVAVEDISFYQYGNYGSLFYPLRAFTVIGNEIVLLPLQFPSVPRGNLLVYYYARPNELVTEDRAAKITSVDYNKGILKVNKIPAAFNTETVFDITSSKNPHKLVGVSVTPDAFASTTNLTYTFGTAKVTNISGTASSFDGGAIIRIADNSSSSTRNIIVWFDLTGADVAPAVPNTQLYIRVDLSAAPTYADRLTALNLAINTALNPLLKSSISGSVLVFQNGGNDISVGDNYSVSAASFSTVVTQSGTNTLPLNMRKNDFMCIEGETVIPQIPQELHKMLAQRVAMRCLESIGDVEGLQAAAVKLQDAEDKSASIIDNRVEGAPKLITNRHGFLNYSRRYRRR